MAEKRAKHAFGALERVDSALQAGTIDAFDILFVKDENGKPYVGWIDKDGKRVVVNDNAEFSALESKVATKADATEVKSELEKKADATEVEEKISQTAQDTIATAKTYTDGKVKAAIEEHLVKKYDIADAPAGTLVDYFDKEIRVMCPTDAVFTKQSVGTGGDPSCYYMTFKTYVTNENAVGYIEHLGNQVDGEILTDIKTDEYGRRYQPTWLALAKYDETTSVWNYYGKDSSKNKYTGWDYQIDWYDANGVMIESDCIRINLSNEQCHYTVEPYYVSQINAEIEMIEKKVEEVVEEVITSNTIVEF